jgi:endo-1,3-1,4-beta-glycanase ExoK
MASFIENFNALDPTLWSISDGYADGSAVYDATWRASNVFLDPVNGLLTLSISPDTGPVATRTYAAGEIRSVGTAYGFGTYSVSMQASAEPGVISSFFLYSGVLGEIDIQLGYFGDHSHGMLQCNYSTNGVPGAASGAIVELGFDPSAAFHTYSIVWTSSGITWLVDGTIVAFASTGDTPVTPGQIFLNCWPTTGNDGWVGDYSGNPTLAVYDWLSYTITGQDVVIGAASFDSGVTSVFANGGTLTGTALLTNHGGSTASYPAVKISSNDPNGNPVDFGLVTNVIVPPGQTITISMPRTFSPVDPLGVWQGFFAYQAADGSWVNGNPFIFYVI